MKLLANKLKLALKDSGVTRKELADHLGVSVAYVGTFANGHRMPHIDTLLEIEKKLKLPPGYLMYDSILPISSKKVPLLNNETLDNFLLHDILPKDVRYIELYTNKEKEKIMLEKCFALKAEGDAMISKNGKSSIFDGDKVVIDMSKKPSLGSIVLAKINNQVKLRIYTTDGNDVFLKAADQHIPAVKLDDSVHVYGVVIQVTRELQ